jgi:hypothetical protein
VLHHGGPGWLQLLVVLCLWNAIKFAALGACVPVLQLGRLIASSGARHRRSVLFATGHVARA